MEWLEVRMQWFGEQARSEEKSDITYEESIGGTVKLEGNRRGIRRVRVRWTKLNRLEDKRKTLEEWESSNREKRL